jgi:hypothetical protein
LPVQPGTRQPGDWAADPAACSLTFAVRNFALGTVTAKDRHCPVRLDVASFTISPDDPAACVDLHATGSLDRRSAGVTAPAFLIGHLVTLSLAIRLRSPERA